MSRSLGLLVATDSLADAELALRLSRAALDTGMEVRLFVMHAGLDRLGDLAPLSDEGADVIACETDLQRLGRSVPSRVLGGSQHDHARLVRDCDRVVSLA